MTVARSRSGRGRFRCRTCDGNAVASDSRGDIAYLSVTSMLTPTTLYHLNTSAAAWIR